MAGYYLCETPRARHPYYIESTRVNIWSIEELCYYMCQNVYLIDDMIINESLCTWLEKELGLVSTAAHLRRVLEKNGAPDEFVMPIFRQCGYVPQAELSYFREQLRQVQVEPRSMRQKMKADYLVHYGMHVSAVEEYKKILEKRSPGRLGIQFYAVVLENMATAYARLFRFEEAAECLWDSYQTLKSRKVYEKYLRLLPLFLPENRYYSRLEEIKADRDLAADMRADTLNVLQEALDSDFAREWEAAALPDRIEQLKKEYVKSTTNAER